MIARRSVLDSRMFERNSDILLLMSDNLLLLTTIPTNTASEGTPIDKAV